MTLAPHAFPDASAPLLELSALEQAARIRDGSLKSSELVALYLARIARHDPAVGAFVQVFEDGARRDAERADAARARGKPLGAFHGVPTALKDLHFVRGSYTRMGSRSWRYLWSPFDDLTTVAMRRAGFVLTGKTATSELALLPIVETDIHPPARNPWETTRTAGGSSGGAGAAIAAGLVPIAPGSDGAGSIRIPSSLCGLVGLKPTRGLVPHAFARVDIQGMASIGPMARNVDDAAALLDVLTGREPGGAGSFLTASRAPARRLTFGILLEPPLGATDPRIAAATREAAKALEAAGHRVVERPQVAATLEEFLPIYQQLLSRVPAPFESKLQPVTRWFRQEGRKHAAADVRAAFEMLTARTLAVLDGVDGLITPTVPILPPKVGAFTGLPPAELFRAVSPLGAFTAAWNITGLPALTIPWTRVEGMPIGVQLVGRAGTDGELFAVGRELENARP